MTGLDLIKWIIKHDAENKTVLIEHRDSGGSYETAERLGAFVNPTLVEYSNEEYDIINTIKYEKGTENFNPNGFIL